MGGGKIAWLKKGAILYLHRVNIFVGSAALYLLRPDKIELIKYMTEFLYVILI